MTKLAKTATIEQLYSSLTEEDAELERKILALQSERAELQLEIKIIQKRIDLNGSIDTVKEEQDKAIIEQNEENPTLAIKAPEEETVNANDSKSVINVAGMTRRDASTAIIRELQQWLSARVIVDYMDKGGIKSTPSAVISMYPVLNKNPDLQFVTGDDGVKLYGLREWTPPESHRKPPSRNGRRHAGGTIGNIVEAFLRTVKQAHITELMGILKEKGITVSRKNLRDSLSRDANKRFKSLGNGSWALNDATPVS